jgi:hypothetical protein
MLLPLLSDTTSSKEFKLCVFENKTPLRNILPKKDDISV